MITGAKFWKGRDITYAKELTPAIKANAVEVIRRVNALLTRAGLKLKDASSGWRPSAVNADAGGAKKSNHMQGLAIDVEDADQALQKWCLKNTAVLEELGLWMEHPRDTPSWCHLQSVAPRSGRRVFYAK